MNAIRPIEIIGGGLAGLSLGLALRREQVPVTIYEAGSYPRHRVCGEFITGLEQSTIQRLGLDAVLSDALPHHEMAWFIGERFTQYQRLPSPALGLSRHCLDARLAAAFKSAGGVLHTNRRLSEQTHPGGWIHAEGRRRGQAQWIGLKIHARSFSTAKELELHLGKECYLGLSRIEDGRVNVCGLFQRQSLAGKGSTLIINYLRQAGLHQLAQRLAEAQFDAASFCAVAALSFDRAIPRTTEIHLGDHAAMIPPFTGNGMAIAFQSAEVALDPLLEYANGNAPWIDTCALVQKKLQRRFNRRLATAHRLHPFLLKPHRQQWLSLLSRSGLLPVQPLFALLH